MEQREVVAEAAADEWAQLRVLLERSRACQRAVTAVAERQRALDARVAQGAAVLAAAPSAADVTPAAALATASERVDALAETLALLRADIERTRSDGWPVLPDDTLLAPYVRPDALRHRLKDAKDLQGDISELL